MGAKVHYNVEYPVTDLDIADFIAKERLEVGEANTEYWELLGGKRTTGKKEEQLTEEEKEEEEKWIEFEKQHPTNVR